ncbi:MAG TPA: DUF4388 domain-containing protein [Kofleriaceae bacterium]|nr:DUF4388 domain-containing protein [Kofleriaceae bacterium]
MELARGQVTDRPWAMTLAALGVRQCTGQLTLEADARQYRIVFDHGAVIGATSPLASDSAARVALIHHMIAPAQAADLTRRIAAAPGRDEIEVIADAARLTLDQTLRLRRKVIEQRAARTFSVDEGKFVIDSNVEVPILSGFAVDVRSVIYLGARMNLSELRLGNELRQLGVRFALRPDALGELGHFGFTAAERPILDALRTGTTVAELEARHRDLDPRTIQAVIYALVTCAFCTGDVPPGLRSEASLAAAANDFSVGSKRGATAPAPSDVYSRGHSGRDVFVNRPPAGSRPAAARRAPAGAPDETGVPRSTRASTSPSTPRTRTLLKPGPPAPAGPATGRAPTARGVAISRTMTPARAVAISRTVTPTRAVATGRAPTPRTAPPASRTPTPTRLPRTRSPGAESVDSAAAAALDPAAAARDAYKRGQSRLRVENLEDAIADLTRAVELAPHEVDYAATLAWARFCHAADKPALAHATREALGRAIRKSPSPETARFYLGRVERMLGRDKEALRHFQEVLQAQPRHADAAAEVRAIEARAAQAAARESGVFGRKR